MTIKRLLLVFALAIASISVAHAQNNFWEKIGLPNDSSVNAIYVTGGGDIYVGSGGTTTGGSAFYSSDDGDNWSNIYNAGGPGVSCIYVMDSDTILIGTGSGTSGVIKKTADGGGSWSSVHTFGMLEVVTSFAVNSSGIFVSSAVYNGSSGKVVFSSDGGDNWTEKQTDKGAIMAMATDGSGNLYIGNHNGEVYKSTDDGDSFTKIRNSTSKDINSIVIDDGDIFIGEESGGVYYSDDGGSNWTAINNGISNRSVTAINIVNDTLYYCGTQQNGVYRTINSGSSWGDVSSGLGWDNVGGGALKLYDNYLYCGTGDGIYKSVNEATYIPAPPGPPKNLTATDGPGVDTLRWEESDSTSSDLVYRIYRRTAGNSFSLHVDDIANGTTEYVDDIENDIRYYYYMVAYDKIKGLESDSTSHVSAMSLLHDPVAPDRPTDLEADAGNGYVDLSWTAAAPGDTYIFFNVYRTQTSGSYDYDNPIAEELTSTTFTDNSVTNENLYYYVVRAENDSSALQSRSSNEASAYPVKPKPQPPQNLSATVSDPDVVLTWDPSSSTDVTEYRVYRSQFQGTGYTEIGTTTPPTTTFTDNPNRDTTFYYIVKAWDDVHESVKSNEVSAMLLRLELFTEVKPESRYIVDRFDSVKYSVQIKDQLDNPVQTWTFIENTVLGQMDSVETDASGYAEYAFEVPGTQTFADYSMSFTSKMADYVPDTVTRVITVKPIPRPTDKWAYVYQESGVAKLIFALEDTTTTWDSPGIPDNIRKEGAVIYINDYVRFEGDMTIDTSANHRIESSGEWSVNSPAGDPNKKVLIKGDIIAVYSGKSINFLRSESAIEQEDPLAGLELLIDDIELQGGAYSTGITLNAYFLLPGVKAGCDSVQTDTIRIEGLVYDEDGRKAGDATISDLSPDAVACFDSLTAEYDSNNDKLNLAGGFSIPWLSVQGEGSITGGELTQIDLSTEQGQAAEIGETGITIRGVSGQANGINPPPMTMSLNGTLLSGTEGLFEIDMSGSVMFPQQLSFNASQARLIHDLTFGDWQIVGPMNGALDVTSNMSIYGQVEAGEMDDGNYIVDGSGNFVYTWSPEERLRGIINGQVMVADFPDEFPWDIIEIVWDGGFPIQLADTSTEIYLQNRIILGNLYFGGLIGTMNFTLDLNKTYGEDGFLEIGTGAMNINSYIRRGDNKDEAVQNFNPYQLEGQSLPMLVRKKEKTQAINQNDTLDLSRGMDKVFIRVMDETEVPESFLLSPNGTKYEAGEEPPEDSSVVYVEKSDGKKGFWVVQDDFEEGEWVAGANPDDVTETSYRDVFATFKKRDIELNVGKEENDVEVTWNNTAVPDEPYIEFYLAGDTVGVTGLMIGEVKEKDGEFNFTMTDTLPECKYFLYAMRYDGDKVDRYYSDVELWNNKGNLQPPQVLNSVYYGLTDKLTVSWEDQNPPENIRGFLIKIVYADQTEEIIARPYGEDREAEIDIEIDLEENPILKITMAAYTHEGYQSCWSEEEGVVLDVKDYPLAGFENENDPISVFPNPLSNGANVRFKLLANSHTTIELFDLLGERKAVIIDDYFEAGVHDAELDATGITSGAYYIRMTAGGVTKSKLIIISK